MLNSPMYRAMARAAREGGETERLIFADWLEDGGRADLAEVARRLKPLPYMSSYRNVEGVGAHRDFVPPRRDDELLHDWLVRVGAAHVPGLRPFDCEWASCVVPVGDDFARFASRKSGMSRQGPCYFVLHGDYALLTEARATWYMHWFIRGKMREESVLRRIMVPVEVGAYEFVGVDPVKVLDP